MTLFVFNHTVLVAILQQVTPLQLVHKPANRNPDMKVICDELSGVLFSFSSVKTQNQTLCWWFPHMCAHAQTHTHTHTHGDVLPQLRAEYLLKRMFDRHPLGTRLKKNMRQNHEQLTDTGQLGEWGREVLYVLQDRIINTGPLDVGPSISITDMSC